MLGLMLGCMLVVVAVFAATNVATIATTKDRIVEPQAAVGFDADAIVVLGASVFADGTPSGILRDRLDDGIALYKEGVAPKLIMSGDNSTVSYNEVQVMKDYAISQGVPSYDIFCDHAGFSTYESMYRAKHVFGAERIVVATQTYHLYRALYAAQGLGLESLGVASDYHDYSKQLQYDLREIPARTKDFFKTLFKVPSTFVGDPHQPRSVRRRHRGLTGSVRGASGARDSHASSANSACASQVTGVEDGDADGSFELRRQADSRKPRAGERDDRCAFFAQASSRRDSGVLTCGRVQIARVANAVGYEVRQQTLA